MKLSNPFQDKLTTSGKITSLLVTKPEADPNPLTEPKWLVQYAGSKFLLKILETQKG